MQVTRWAYLILAGSYCFIWPRVSLGVVDLPIQRLLVVLTALVLIVTGIVHRKALVARLPGRLLGRAGGLAAALALGLTIVTVIGFAVHVSVAGFNSLAWLMDLVKYLACFATMTMTYLVLRLRIVAMRSIASAVIVSSLACIVISYGCLVAYLAGVRSTNATFLRSFGGAIGVWPTDGVLPRLVGTSSEPQQLSVLFVTGLLLMVLSRRRALWVGAAAGLGVLLLSQSKYALASAGVVVLVAIVIAGSRAGLRRRGWLGLGGVSAVTGAAVLVGLAQLPIFAQTLREGVSATAVQERLQNAGVLSELVERYFWQGIGSGQYGIYRGHILGVTPDAWYYPNNDYMKVFAELGVFGFVGLIALIVVLVGGYALRVAQRRGEPMSLMFALGAVLILCNMVIGYEMLHIFLWVNLGVTAFALDRRGSAATR